MTYNAALWVQIHFHFLIFVISKSVDIASVILFSANMYESLFLCCFCLESDARRRRDLIHSLGNYKPETYSWYMQAKHLATIIQGTCSSW